ncbi:hypothetical protein AVEN_129278-1 [Araneus ventricosus]|uniref:Uncharacterized protein n=1 Tax=Araneus ventricosus TaxID=182803 RepID=A0A4Y2PC07_ARAVE|nr:hypothetical protein AVEN_13937-1 [Araneus ventricosus]GBN48761.1 hypothetical protein AVEN_129278-1 [Araneus ventricosus]
MTHFNSNSYPDICAKTEKSSFFSPNSFSLTPGTHIRFMSNKSLRKKATEALSGLKYSDSSWSVHAHFHRARESLMSCPNFCFARSHQIRRKLEQCGEASAYFTTAIIVLLASSSSCVSLD